MADAAAFWDRLARRYATQPISDPAAYDRTMERTRAHLSERDTALEIGCGTGMTALRLADAVGHLDATDLSPEMIAIARERAEAAGPDGVKNVTFGVADIFANDPPEKPYDAVLAFNLLHLTRDPAAALRHIATLIRPGGLFVSKTVCLAHAGPHIRLLIPLMRLVGKAPFVLFLTIDKLERIIEGAGFDIIETGTFPGKPPSRFVVARRKAAI